MTAVVDTLSPDPTRPAPGARILVVVGTRPEAVKLAPVIAELRARPWAEVRVVATAQHREMLDQVLHFFRIRPDVDLDLMREDQSLADLLGRGIRALDELLVAEKPDVVLAQGDTTTVLATGMSCHYRHVRFAHVEAGLRTHRRDQPFPEEMNRTFAGWLADLHFAPTEAARANLLREGVAGDRIQVTGNTVVDAVSWAARQELPRAFEDMAAGRPLVLVTAHRRESFGGPLAEICGAVGEIASTRDVTVVYPVHPNPTVRAAVHELLGDHPRVRLVPPLPYPDFVAAMQSASVILTDSGGVQEEAASLGVPVLVLRAATERPEGVAAGTARLVAPHRAGIVHETVALLDDAAARERMARAPNPYGDGRAASRIATALEAFVGRRARASR